MPSDAAAAFRDVFQTAGGLSEGEAAKFMRQLELHRRYQVEAW